MKTFLHFFTILIAPIVSNGPRARTIQVPLGSARFEVKGNRKRRQTFMGAQIILGTPLFWARFRNVDVSDRSSRRQEHAAIFESIQTKRLCEQ